MMGIYATPVFTWGPELLRTRKTITQCYLQLAWWRVQKEHEKARKRLQLVCWRVQKEYEQNGKRAMGPGAVFQEIANHFGWKGEEGLFIQIKDRS